MRRLKAICLGLLIASTLSSGCIKKPVYIIEGEADYFEIPTGTELYIQDLLAPDNEPTMKKVKTMKPGAFFSVDAQTDALQARAK